MVACNVLMTQLVQPLPPNTLRFACTLFAALQGGERSEHCEDALCLGQTLHHSLASVQLRMVASAVRKAHADDRARQRLMPDVAFFAKQAVEFLANTAARLRGLQRAGSVPGLFPQVPVAQALCALCAAAADSACMLPTEKTRALNLRCAWLQPCT